MDVLACRGRCLVSAVQLFVKQRDIAFYCLFWLFLLLWASILHHGKAPVSVLHRGFEVAVKIFFVADTID